MPCTEAQAVIARYFDAFNRGDIQGMLAEVTADVEHHVNQGGVRHGREAFGEFCTHMARLYREEVRDLVIMEASGGTRAAAEYVVHGTYLQADPGQPPARGQQYVLPAGSFFTLREGRIARVATCYNVADWVRQVT
jgi:steroid delta-isomerase-like uncharacterized protein